MKDKGYDDDNVVNVMVTSSIAGILFPPSHNMILFAVATGGGTSILQLFVAGIVPGVLMCISVDELDDGVLTTDGRSGLLESS